MKQRDLSLVGLILLVVFGVRFMPQSGAVAGTPTSAKRSETATTQTPPASEPKVPELWATLCKLNPDYVAQPSGADVHCLKGPRVGSIATVIATVPDPMRTHLRLWTDRTIESMQAAAAEAGYVPYLQALTWAISSGAANSPSQTSPYQAAQKYPGVLIFRNSKKKRDASSEQLSADYLVVFVVPETPAAGIDQEIFYAALRIIDNEIPKADSDPLKPPTVLVAGPSFSGSVLSLRDIEGKLAHENPHCFHAYSGTVTNAEFQNQHPRCQSKLTSLQTPDQEALNAFAKGVYGLGYKRNQIAILSEEGTDYGEQNDQPEILFLHFPRGIATLRNASEPAQSEPSQASGKSPQGTMQLSWQDTESGQADEVPSYGSQVTAVSQEASLAIVAQTIKRQGFKALGILATDPMDVAFLIHWFKMACPDIRLFVRDVDLLYLRTPDVGTAAGVLAVNNYVLLPQHPHWSPGNNERHLLHFPSSAQQGQYDAFTNVLYEMANQEPLLSPLPLWLATAGTAGYFPLDWLTEKGRMPPTFSNLGRPPYAAILLFAMFAFIATAHATCLWQPNWAPRYFKSEFDLGDQEDAITAAKGVCHVLALLCISLASLAAGFSFAYFFWASYHVSGLGISRTAYGVLAVLVIVCELYCLGLVSIVSKKTIAMLCRSTVVTPKKQSAAHDRDHTDKISLPSLRFLGSLFTLLFLLGTVFWCYWLPRNANIFFYWRNLCLTSGVAPTLPIVLLLTTIYLGIWVYLRRISWWECGSVKMPTERMDDVFPSDCNKEVDFIDQCMLRFPPSPWGYLLGGAYLAGILALWPWSTLNMLEPGWIQFFVIFSFCLALLFLWSNWVRFLAIWGELKKILAMLEKLPMRAAFSRLPRDGPLSITGWSVPGKSFLPLRQAVESLHALKAIDSNMVEKEMRNAVLHGIAALSNPQALAEPVERPQELRKAVGASASASGPQTGQPDATSIDAGKVRAIQATAGSQLRQAAMRGADLQKSEDSTAQQKEKLHRARRAMTELINELIPHLRREYWNRADSLTAGMELVSNQKRRNPDSSNLKFELAEDLIALRYYSYIRYVSTEVRSLLFFLVTSFVLLFAALHTYPFRSGRAIDLFFMVVFLVIGSSVFIVLLQQERNALLSSLQQTNADEVGKNFYFDLVKYGAIPLLTLIGSQVPSVSNFLLRWLQPNLAAFR